MSRDEATRLTDILEAAEAIQSYTARDPDLGDPLVQDAILLRLAAAVERLLHS